TTRAFITDSDQVNRTTVYSGDNVEVNALTRENVKSFAAGAGGGLVGLAGSVTAAEIDSDIDAYISESNVNATNDVRVLANSGASIDAFAGILAGGAA